MCFTILRLFTLTFAMFVMTLLPISLIKAASSTILIYEYQSNTGLSVPTLPRSGTLVLANDGDQLVLRNSSAIIIDSVVYKNGSTAGTD